jgi:hypothetical protein
MTSQSDHMKDVADRASDTDEWFEIGPERGSWEWSCPTCGSKGAFRAEFVKEK